MHSRCCAQAHSPQGEWLEGPTLSTACLAAQVSKKLGDADSATAFSLGYAKRLQGGSLAKLKLSNTGARPTCRR